MPFLVAITFGHRRNRSRLLELGKILHRLDAALRAEQPLDLHAAQRWGDDAMTGLPVDGRRVDAWPWLVWPFEWQSKHVAPRLHQLGAAVPLRLIKLLLRGTEGDEATQTF